ncbi:Superoxide dismutase [Cu-Zn] [Geodia barretti]|uniref:Superoxide dismutase [Cu-Zn] n=1 Tax=Geodia barretti TaxID=519541 RepID=A0AA35WP23_GEOBA|nr:Superoxide dismutase [Cu-Zn] [Geodia barretti]
MPLRNFPTFLAIVAGVAGFLSAEGRSDAVYDLKKNPEQLEALGGTYESSVISEALKCLVVNSVCNSDTGKLADIFSQAARGAATSEADVCQEELEDVEDMIKRIVAVSSLTSLEKREIRERRRGRHRRPGRRRRPGRPHSHGSRYSDSTSREEERQITEAVVVLEGSDTVEGTITFTAQENGKTRVRGTVSGLAQGNHGFHVHQFGDYSPSEGCANAGGHFNPAGRQHGGPNDDERHAGDLGNIVADASGVAVIDVEDCQIPLSGENSIIGRSVVVHADEDDLGRGGFPDSLTTGHAGARLACGVIGIANTS